VRLSTTRWPRARRAASSCPGCGISARGPRPWRKLTCEYSGAHRRELGDRLLRLEHGPLARGQLLGGCQRRSRCLPGACRDPWCAARCRAPGPRYVCSVGVTLPRNVSLTTMFWPWSRRCSCSTARVSMSWKLSVRRSPCIPSCPGQRRRPWPRTQLEHVLAVGLCRRAARSRPQRHHDARPDGGARHVEGAHRRREIEHVVTLGLLRCEVGSREITTMQPALLLEAGLHALVAGPDDDATGAVRAAPEVHLLDAGVGGARTRARDRPRPPSRKRPLPPRRARASSRPCCRKPASGKGSIWSRLNTSRVRPEASAAGRWCRRRPS